MLGFILIGFAVLFLWASISSDPDFIVAFVGTTVAAFFATLAPYYMQINNWIVYNSIDKKIENAESIKKALKENMLEYKEPSSTFINGDTPYATTMTKYVEIEQEILKLKQEKVDKEIEIKYNEVGFNGYWCKLARPSGVNVDFLE